MPETPAQGPVATITVLHCDDRPPQLEQRVGSAELRFATPDTLPDALPGAEVLLVWDFTSDAVARAWPAADVLRWVHTASAGVDRVTFPAAIASEVAITNSRGIFDAPIAEYVLGLVLAFAKDLPATLAAQGRRQWRHRETEPVAGRTAVVVGSGPIGRAVARLLDCVGMHTRLVGRRSSEGVHAFDALTSLLPEADVLVLAAPLTDATRGMLDAAALALMKPTARVVNIGRGDLVVEPDLVAALSEGRIAGAGLDVFGTEPLPTDSPLWELPQVIVSPHMSGDLVGWRDALVDVFVDNLDRYRAGKPLRNVVDKRLGYVSGEGENP